MDNVISANTGRIVYFEPNGLFGEDNQPVNQEDLTKYVNLSVKIPSRFYKEDDLREEYESILKGTPFNKDDRGYTKFYLTDNYVNISYNEFGKDGKINNGELFGVESISISFDIQLIPIVNIVFKDVKGVGLMGMEHDLRRDGDLTARHFFTALFNFPYPIFTLEVKGYYGKSVSYDLCLKDFNTTFDSLTGDFKTTVSFIGHLYGVYADIPLSFLLVSPYLEKSNFNVNDKILPTYLEFIEKYKTLLDSDENNSHYTGINTYINTTNLINKLSLAKELIENIYKDSELVKKRYAFKTTEKGKEIVMHNGTEQDSLFGDSSVGGELVFVLEEKNEKLLNNIGSIQALRTKIYDGELPIDYDVTVEQNQKMGNYYLFYLKNYNIDTINEEINKLSSSIDNQLVRVNNELKYYVTEKFGFEPTIKNIYKILFKHLECFSDVFYNTIKNVSNLRKSNLTNVGNIISDVVNFDDDALIPPFPMFFNKTKKEIIYPGYIEGFKEREEIKLVEDIYKKTVSWIEENVEYEKEVNQLIAENNEEITEKIYFEGSFFADIISPTKIKTKYKNYNVLTNFIEKKTVEESASAICDIFLARLNTYIRLYDTKDNSTSIDYFVKSEINLLFNALPTLSRDIAFKLYEMCDKDLTKRFDELSGGTKWGYINYNPDSELDENENITRIDNFNIENTLLIYIQGSHSLCTNFYTNCKLKNFKKEIDRLNYTNYYNKNNNGYCCNRFDRKTNVCLWGNWSQDLQGELGSNRYYCGRKASYDYVVSDTPFISSINPTDKTFRKVISDTYEYKTDEYRIWDEHVMSLKKEEVERTGSYKTYTCDKNEKNKIILISLFHLVTAGEALYYGKIDGYYVPVSLYDGLAPQLNDWDSFTYLKHFQNGTIFKEATVALYKKFCLKETLTPTEEEYYNYFNIPSNISNLEDTTEYFFVIGKNFLYTADKITLPDVLGKLKNEINKIFNFQVKNVSEERLLNEQNNDLMIEAKTNIYYQLKNLYDKWYAGLKSDFFSLSKVDNEGNNISEFNRMDFITTQFIDISEKMIVNLDGYVQMLFNIKNGESKSLLSHMSEIAQNNESTLITLPTKIFNDNLEDIFKPYNFYNGELKHKYHTSSFIFLQNGDMSHYLDTNGEYTQDGFSIADYDNGILAITKDATNLYGVIDEIEKQIPIKAFGVTYGLQNQNIFSKIDVNTNTPQMTDYSIANLLKIAEGGNNMVVNNGLTQIKQSLYPTYANRSYVCNVEMMGCMEITPLLFFQLNNIPMFKGAYIITNVEHLITPQKFTTTFSGVRISKYNIPLNTNPIRLNNLKSENFSQITVASTTTSNLLFPDTRDFSSEQELADLGVPTAITIHTSAGTGLTVEDYHIMHLKNEMGNMDGKGFGYHFFIDRNGDIFPGRPFTKKGCHVGGANSGNIGICFEGPNMKTKGWPNEKQKKTMAAAVYIIKTNKNIDNSNIKGHRDYPNVNKACPNFDVQGEMMGENGWYNTLIDSIRKEKEYSEYDPVLLKGFNMTTSVFTDDYSVLCYLSHYFKNKYYLWGESAKVFL